MKNASNAVTHQEENKVLTGFRAMNDDQQSAYLRLAELLSEENNDSERVIKKLHDSFPELKNTTFFEDLSDYIGSKDETVI